jgi:phosphoribosylglycinamide formyltransferase 1
VKRLAVLISGRGSNMASIANACRERGWPARIELVLASRDDAPGLGDARALGLRCGCIDHRGHADRETFDRALADSLDAVEPDLVLLAGFMRILGDDFTRRYAGRLLNIHPSLLPAFPGLHTHRRALQEGVQVHGATVHYVTPSLDHGPIVAQAAVPVLPDDDEARLSARVLRAEHRLYPMAVEWIVRDRVALRGGRVGVDGLAPGDRLLFDPNP